MGGMHLTTSLNHKNRAIGQLADVFSFVKTSGMASADLNKRVLQIMGTLDKCPQWVQSYVQGWSDATRRNLEQELVFFYTMPDGELVSTHRNVQ